jgi:hypothetical protein
MTSGSDKLPSSMEDQSIFITAMITQENSMKN